MEANPANIDEDKARILADYGVTRVSMGAQSFIPDELAALDRIHAPGDVAPSVELLRRHGIRELNLDLIFGIRGRHSIPTGSRYAARLSLAPITSPAMD